MADDKGAGGGGWDWGALEIILGIILAIGLLDRLSGRTEPTSAPGRNAVPTEPTYLSNAADPMCGLSLRSPKPLEKITVGGALELVGTVSGCHWDAEGSVALYAQAVDSKGFPVSPYTTVLPKSRNRERGTASFDAIVPITGIPAAGTGYLLLLPSQQDGSETVTARIPIQFQK